MLETVTRTLLQALHALINRIAQLPHLQPTQIGMLVEIVLKSVILEQLFIIRRIVRILIEGLEFVPDDQQPPPGVPGTEIDRTVHRLHTPAGKPHAGRIEKLIGQLLIVDSLEKAASSRRLFLQESMFPIVKSGDTSHHFSFFIACDPANGLAVGEQFIFLRVENSPDRRIEGTYPITIPLIDFPRQIEELPFRTGIDDLLQNVLV